MGLFKKRSTDPAELDRLRSEISAMAARLDAADAGRAEIDHRLHGIATRLDQPVPEPPPAPPTVDPAELDAMRARIQRLDARIEQLPSPVEAPSIDPAIVRSLDGRIDALRAHLDAALAANEADPVIDPAELDALRTRIEQLDARLDERTATPPPPPPAPAPAPAPAPTIDPAELDALRTRIEQLDARIGAIDSRITSISTELANQLTELSGEIDSITGQPASPAVTDQTVDVDEVVEEIRDAQVRLANEQARYQIAFRQELADLAQRLRRS